jgi:hypothetical protein
MLKRKLITGVSLIVIFVSIFGILKTIFDASPVQSTTTTVPKVASSTPNIVQLSTPGIEPMPQPGKSKPTATVPITAISSPGNLAMSTIPRPEATPKSAQSAPTTTAEPIPTTTAEPTPTLKPLKRRVVKHQPDQFRKGAISKEEMSAIKKAIKTIPWSRNSDPKAAADEDYAAIVKECEKSGVDGLLTDLVTEAVSNDYQPNNEAANSAYITELNSDCENDVKIDRKNEKAQ